MPVDAEYELFDAPVAVGEREPAATFDAQLPGSMKPTVTRKPGPMYFRSSNACRRGV